MLVASCGTPTPTPPSIASPSAGASISIVVPVTTPVATDEPTASVPPTPEPTPAKAAVTDGPRLEWREVKVPLALGDNLLGLSALGSGFVAVGYRCSARRDYCLDPTALTWTSPDGLSWREHQIPRPAGLALVAVSPGEEGVQAFGYRRVGSRWRAALFGSTDGRAWHETDTVASISGPPCRIDVDGDGRAFCAGRILRSTSGVLIKSGGGVWTTADGSSWLAYDVSTDPNFALPGGYNPPMVAAGPGGFAAVNIDLDPVLSDIDPNTPGTIQFWAASDGRTWRQQPPPAGGAHFADLLFTSFEGWPDGYAALGYTSVTGIGSIPGCWASRDGIDWTRYTDGPPQVWVSSSDASGALVLVIDGATGVFEAWRTQGDCAWQRTVGIRPRNHDVWGGPLLTTSHGRIVFLGTDGRTARALVGFPTR